MPKITNKITNASLDIGALDDFEVIGGYKVVQTMEDLIKLKNIQLYSVANPTEDEIKAAQGKHILTNGTPVFVAKENVTYRWDDGRKEFVSDTSSSGSGGSGGVVAIVIDEELSTESKNPVQNKVITAALNNKVEKEDGKGLSTYDYTAADRQRVNKIMTTGNGTSFLSSDGTYKSFTGNIKELTFTDDGNGNVIVTPFFGTISFTSDNDGNVMLEAN
jgi:hypothetical protein